MATAQGGGGLTGSANRLKANGLVISIGLEKFISRAQSAVAAARPLIESMQKIATTSENMSRASGGAIQFKTERLRQTASGLTEVADHADSALHSLGSMAGSFALLSSRLLTGVALVATFVKWQSILAGGSLKVANGMDLVSNATGVLSGKLNPIAGGTAFLVRAMQLLPFGLGKVGNTALAAGLGLGVLTGGIGPLSAGIGLLNVGFSKLPGQLGKYVTAAGAALTSFGLMSAAITSLSVVTMGLVFTLGALGPALTFGTKLAAEAEQSQIAFEVMLGSAEDAKALLGNLRDFAVKTPFSEDELIASGRSLLAFGEQAANIVPALTRIGDVSSGIGAPIKEIAELYGKARVQGRLFAQDINQLTNRGIPIIQELAQQFGVTDDAVKKLVADGEVNFQHLERAFISLTAEGGRFAGLTEKQSRSLAGVWSSFKDEIRASLRSVGEQFVKTGVLQRGMAQGSVLIAKMTGPLILFGKVVALGLDWMVDLAQILAGAVTLMERVAHAFRSWAGFVQVLIPALALLAAGLLVVVAAQKAYALAQIAVLALSGPKGWAQLAAGAVIAAGAIYGFGVAMKSANAAVAEAKTELQAVNKEARAIAPMQLIGEEQTERMRKAEEFVTRYRTKSEALKLEWREIDKAFSAVADRKKFGLEALDAHTGVVSEIKSLTREIEILSGRATEAQHKLQDMLAAGAPKHMVEQVRKLQEQRDEAQSAKERRDALAKEQSKVKEEKSRQRDDSERQRKDSIAQIRDGLTPPIQKLMREMNQTVALGVGEGALSPQEIAEWNKKLLRDFHVAEAERQENVGVTANTDEAMSAIVSAITARNPNVKVEDLMEYLNETAIAQKIELEKINQNLWLNGTQLEAAQEARFP